MNGHLGRLTYHILSQELLHNVQPVLLGSKIRVSSSITSGNLTYYCWPSERDETQAGCFVGLQLPLITEASGETEPQVLLLSLATVLCGFLSFALK